MPKITAPCIPSYGCLHCARRTLLPHLIAEPSPGSKVLVQAQLEEKRRGGRWGGTKVLTTLGTWLAPARPFIGQSFKKHLKLNLEYYLMYCTACTLSEWGWGVQHPVDFGHKADFHLLPGWDLGCHML